MCECFDSGGGTPGCLPPEFFGSILTSELMRGFEVLLPLGSLYSQEYKSILFHSYILGANIKATASVIIT